MGGLNQTGRGSLSAMLSCCIAAAALLIGTSSAFADTNCGPPNSLSGSCFAAGDGNQADGPGDLVDWQSYVPLAALVDGAKGSDSKYKGGSKELEPGGWEFITGNNTPKTDLLNGWGRLDNGFLNVAFTRVKQQGNTYLGFELNQLGAGPRESGGIPVPHRSTGDVLITYDISTTNKISVGMCTWAGDENSGQWLRLDGTPVAANVKQCTQLDPNTNPAAMGAVNFGQPLSAAENWLEDNAAGIGAGQFGEASVNLNGLPEGAGRFLTDPCGPNGWFWMHSRASDTVTSEPKDILPGKPIADPTCGLTIDKKVSLSGAAGTFTDAVDAEVGDTVTYAITLKNTGTAALSVDVSDPRCNAGTLSGPAGRDGSDDPLAAGESVTYTCTHLVTADDPNPLVNTACTTGTATLGGASKTLGLDPAICDSATVNVFQAGSLAKATGTKFQDLNGNHARDDGERPLAGFVFYVDYNGNGALDAGEPAAVSDEGGNWQISGIQPGDHQVREAADPNYTCTLPADGCMRSVTFTGGQTANAGEWGNQPNAGVSPETQGAQAPKQLVLGARIAPGRARLLGPVGCQARAFRARVKGTKIAKVVFYLDGHKIKTLKRVNFRKSFAVRIDPRRLALGVHRVRAVVTFQRGSATKPKTFRLSFQRCPRALRAPRFTG